MPGRASTRARLEAELARIEARLPRSVLEAEPSVVDRCAAGNLAWLTAFEREELNAQAVTRDWIRRGEVLAALERIDSERYGHCANCGKPIEEGRLDAFPETTRCAGCAI